MDTLAIVILNYNGEHYLRQFLPHFIEHSESHPIYVADNASTDDSLLVLENEFPSIRRIVLDQNYGFTEGYNKALKQIESEYYLIVNSDIEVTPAWTAPLLSFLESNPIHVACQPKIKSYHQKTHFEYAGAAGGHIDCLGYPFCRGRIFDQLEEDKGQYDSIENIFWSTGACMMIRSKIFHELGGFDPDFFAHMEEIDLCWRAHHKGYLIAAVPQSTVYHVGGGTLSSINPRKTYLNFRNGLSLLVKNLPLSEYWKLPVRILLDWIAALKFLLEGNLNHSLAVFKAHAKWTLLFGHNYKKRPDIIKPITDTQDKNVFSVVADHYIKGKKKFSEL